MRAFLRIDVLQNRRISSSSNDIEKSEHFVRFDQLASLLDRFRWPETIVVRDELDLSAVDPALLVYHLEVSGLGLSDGGISRLGAAVGHYVADLYRGLGNSLF